MIPDEILTVADVSKEMKCSKAHVHNTINGKVKGVTQLPAIHMGGRKLVCRSALEMWKRANEKASFDAMMPASPEVNAVRPMKEDFHA